MKRTPVIYNERYQALIALLVSIRKQQDLTQADVAQATGIPRYDISKIETCVRRLDILEFEQICQVLNLKIDLLKWLREA